MVQHQPWLPHDYEQKYVAYFDIIGFKEIVRTIENDRDLGPELFHILSRVFDEIDQELRMSNSVTAAAADHAVYSMFSDNVAISTTASPGGLMSLVTRVSTLAMRLMRRGIFVRGGIAKGPLYHQPNKLVGSAMIEAVGLEQSLARYPRIVLSDAVLADGAGLQQSLVQWWQEIQLPDHDGVRVLSPFYPYYASNSALDASGPTFAEDHFGAVAAYIRPMLQRPSADERRAKMAWLSAMLNDRCNYYVASGLLNPATKPI